MPLRHHTFEHSVFVNVNKKNEKKGSFSIIKAFIPKFILQLFKSNKEFPLMGQLGFQSMATPQGEAIISFYHLVIVLMTAVLGFTF
jgi:hypothetical protein